MKFILLPFICLLSFIGQGFGQSAEGQEFGEDIKLWLKPGEHKVDLMSIKSGVNSRQMELSNKVMKAMQKNGAWVRDSLATVTDSTIIYEKFGLTKAEFEEYFYAPDTKAQTPQLIKTGDETLVIKRKKNTLTFRGTGRLKVLDSLKFNVQLNEPIYNGMQIEFGNKSGAEDDNNPFKSAWTGYHYSYEDYGDILEGDPQHLTTTKISFDVGKLTSGKTIIMFMLMRINNGKPVQNATAICLFD
jgi:hypothetical protein